MAGRDLSRSLVATTLAIRDLDQRVHGAYQRFRTLLEATCGVSDSVDVWSVGLPQGATSGKEDEEGAASIREFWGLNCQVFNGLWAQQTPVSPWLVEQLLWVLNYRRSRAFWGLDNPINSALLARLSDRPLDLVVLHKLPSIELVGHALPAGVPMLFDLDDIEYVAHERHSRLIENPRERWVSLAMVPAIRRAVGRALRRATHTFVCSAGDKDLLDSAFGLDPGRVVVVPNAIAVGPRAPVVAAPVLMFVGSFVWEPNVQAVEYFLTRCWEHVLAAVPDARLFIVGKDAERVPSFARQIHGVEFMGFVEDLAEVYGRARVVICPILSGGGTRVKLVEAAAFGKPIVSTEIGAEGLGFVDGLHALMAQDERSFADACVRLLTDDQLCDRMSRAAHEYTSRTFDRVSSIGAMQAVMRDCLTGLRVAAPRQAG